MDWNWHIIRFPNFDHFDTENRFCSGSDFMMLEWYWQWFRGITVAISLARLLPIKGNLYRRFQWASLTGVWCRCSRCCLSLHISAPDLVLTTLTVWKRWNTKMSNATYIVHRTTCFHTSNRLHLLGAIQRFDPARIEMVNPRTSHARV